MINENKIRTLVKEELKEIERVVHDFPWEDPQAYGHWCVQTYKYVCHSAPLIKKCAETLPPRRT